MCDKFVESIYKAVNPKIKELEAENQRLRSALEKIKEHAHLFAENEIEDMAEDALKIKNIDNLLSEYTDEINAGIKPNKAEYLAQCPISNRQELAELMGMLDVLDRNRDALKEATTPEVDVDAEEEWHL